jgi:chromosome partitioning protein
VLVVDLDPQVNASRWLACRWSRREPRPTISEAVKADAEGVAEDAIVPCQWYHSAGLAIDVLPSRINLQRESQKPGLSARSAGSAAS